MPQLLTSEDMQRALRRIAHEIIERHRGVEEVVLLGVKTRGSHLAGLLQQTIEQFENFRIPTADLDITAFRDDRPRNGSSAGSNGSLPDINGKKVVIVDDVLYTGRTVRAALDAIAEMGRASKIELAVLVDRGHREIPVRPDYVGKNIPTAHNERVSVHVEQVDGDQGVWLEKELP